jgi:hypothetical protein
MGTLVFDTLGLAGFGLFLSKPWIEAKLFCAESFRESTEELSGS